MRNHSISQFAEEPIGIGTYLGGALRDADGSVLVTIIRSADAQAVVNNQVATHDGLGLYSFLLDASVTEELGDYIAFWSYSMNGNDRIFEDSFNVGLSQPHWDFLNADQKQMVDDVMANVADNPDSRLGGPYLWELPQTTFGYETVARLMTVNAMSYINLTGFPPFQFALGAEVDNPFPTAWYGLAHKATFYELLKHLSRSYIEMPVVAGGPSYARFDRRDYRQRWQEEARQEKEELDAMLVQLKRQYYMTFRSRSLLVAGNMFPISWFNPARPRWPYVSVRF